MSERTEIEIAILSTCSTYERELARRLRLFAIQAEYDTGNLTEAEARELLAGRLAPNDEKSVVDDSEYLQVKSF